MTDQVDDGGLKSADKCCDGHKSDGKSDPLLANEEHDDKNREPDFHRDRTVKHIMVIGFHHKHGYQVDYCYPPLTPGGPIFSTATQTIKLPLCWKTLPLLCLPDGSHNYDNDTIYFTMPDREVEDNRSCAEELDPQSRLGIKTVFGTACYRQIQADKLLNRTDDMTRVTVQKSVCILSTKPLFGLIRSKLEMITHAYFSELDFSQVNILKLTYENLNSLLSKDSIRENATFLGLSARQLVSQFGHNTLVIFKAMLLEKKILFYKSPVRDLCSTIISMCSLFTGLLECSGLDYSTCDLQLSPTLLETLKLSGPEAPSTNCDVISEHSTSEAKVLFSPSKEEVVILKDSDEILGSEKDWHSTDKDELADQKASIIEPVFNEEKAKKQSAVHNASEGDDLGARTLADETLIDDPHALRLCRLQPEDCGLPLQIFTHGSFCLPYLSISYLDLLSDSRIKSFVIGATNFLFKQKSEMYDMIVDMDDDTITINDPDLKKSLGLTAEDLRFMDYLGRHIELDGSCPRDEFDLMSHDTTKWIGGDEWIRFYFRLYTLYLLRAAKTEISLKSFNAHFVKTWKQTTNNYKTWDSMGKSSILDALQPRHPFSLGDKGLNFSDMKLKLSYAVNSSERGKKINQTLNIISKWSIWGNIASAATLATNPSSSQRPDSANRPPAFEPESEKPRTDT